MATIRVHTAQNVTLEYQVASIGNRIVATIIDFLVIIAWIAAWMGLVFWLAGDTGKSSSAGSLWPVRSAADVVAIAFLCFIFSPLLFYHLVSEILLNGQSIGKKAQNLRVVRLDGTSPRIGNYFIRWLLRLIDMQFYGVVAMVTIAATGKGQRLGDLAAGTSVISLKAPPTVLPDLSSLVSPAGYQPVFPQAASLSDHDVSLLNQLLDRATRMNNYDLLHETANKIKALLNLHTDLDDVAFLRTVLRDHYHLVHEEQTLR